MDKNLIIGLIIASLGVGLLGVSKIIEHSIAAGCGLIAVAIFLLIFNIVLLKKTSKSNQDKTK